MSGFFAGVHFIGSTVSPMTVFFLLIILVYVKTMLYNLDSVMLKFKE